MLIIPSQRKTTGNSPTTKPSASSWGAAFLCFYLVLLLLGTAPAGQTTSSRRGLVVWSCYVRSLHVPKLFGFKSSLFVFIVVVLIRLHQRFVLHEFARPWASLKIWFYCHTPEQAVWMLLLTKSCTAGCERCLTFKDTANLGYIESEGTESGLIFSTTQHPKSLLSTTGLLSGVFQTQRERNTSLKCSQWISTGLVETWFSNSKVYSKTFSRSEQD